MPAPLPNLELTTTEKAVLREYIKHIEATGVEPTKAWLSRKLKLHYNSVVDCYRRLKNKGYMKEEKITTTRLTLSAKAKKAAL
jgi:Mn-dependent DtxR family transcriptional regulator